MGWSVARVAIFRHRLSFRFEIEMTKTIRTSPEELDSHHKASLLSWDNDSDSLVSMVRAGQPGGSPGRGKRRRDGSRNPWSAYFPLFVVGLYVVVATHFLFAVEMIPM